VIVRSADIGGIVDHHCLCFLFTILCRLRAAMGWYMWINNYLCNQIQIVSSLKVLVCQ